MKAIFQCADLKYVGAIARGFTLSQSTLPILEHFLIKASDDTVDIYVSDMEHHVHCSIPARVEEPGAMTLPSQKFFELINRLPDADVGLVPDEKNPQLANIRCMGDLYKMTTLDPNDYPQWPHYESQTVVDLSQKNMKKVIRKIGYAILTKDPRKFLTGGYFRVKDNQLIAAGTDGHKLAEVRVPVEAVSGEGDNTALVPQKMLNEVVKILGDEGNVRLIIDEKIVAFKVDRVTFASTKIKEQFPDYEVVIPKEFHHFVKVDKEDFVRHIERAAIFSESRSNSVRLAVKPNEVKIRAMTFDLGSAQVSMPIGYDGESFEIAFNHRFVSETFRVIDTSEVLIKVKDPNSPVICEGVGEEGALYLIMPIKLAVLNEIQDIEEEEGA